MKTILGFAGQPSQSRQEQDQQKPAAKKSSASLKPTFEQYGLPLYRQDGPWCWAYTSNSVIEYEHAQLQRRGLALSTGFLTWAAQECDKLGTGGSNFGRASRGVNTFGVVPLSLYGEPTAQTPVPTPPRPIITQGERSFGVEFQWLRFWSRERVSDIQFQAIQEELATGHPVAVGMQWPKVTEFVPDTFLLPYPSPSGYSDGHCVVLCGYQEDSRCAGGGYFSFRNSWGRNWAEQGYAYMTYQMLRAYLNDAYSVRVVQKRIVPEGAQRFTASELLGNLSTGVSRQKMENYGKAWGEKPQVLFQPTGFQRELKLCLTVAEAGSYQIFGSFTMAEDYGTYTITVNGGSSKITWNGASAGVSLAAPILIGTFSLKQGVNEVVFRLRGRSSASRGGLLGVHQLLIARQG